MQCSRRLPHFPDSSTCVHLYPAPCLLAWGYDATCMPPSLLRPKTGTFRQKLHEATPLLAGVWLYQVMHDVIGVHRT
eukprot:6454943-Amphidinium_carterae.2